LNSILENRFCEQLVQNRRLVMRRNRIRFVLLLRFVHAIDTYLLGSDKNRLRAYIGKLYVEISSYGNLLTELQSKFSSHYGADRLASIIEQGVCGTKERQVAPIEEVVAKLCLKVRTGIEKRFLKKRET
jgi:hypothetical protein